MDLSDITSLPTEQLAAIKAALGIAETSAHPFGWSPQFSKGVLASNPRQLHNLNLKPKANDPRPTFFWSAEESRDIDMTRTLPYPRLMWDGSTGREVTVTDAKEQATYTAKGFVLTAPGNAEAADPVEVVRQQFEGLSAEDRKAVLASAQKSRLAKIEEAMAGLSDADIAMLAASLEPKKRTA